MNPIITWTSRLFLAFSLAAVAGCASTTVNVGGTTPIIVQSAQNGMLAAQCIMKNIDEQYGTMDAKLQSNSRPNMVEIRVRSAAAGVAAIVEIEPTEKGSTITTRISNHYPFKDALARGFTSGC